MKINENQTRLSKDADLLSKLGCQIRMLRSAKEWAAGDIYVVRGASSGCWKTVGKNGTHHQAVNKVDDGKVWSWLKPHGRKTAGSGEAGRREVDDTSHPSKRSRTQ